MTSPLRLAAAAAAPPDPGPRPTLAWVDIALLRVDRRYQALRR